MPSLKEEVKTLNEKLSSLKDEELEQVAGATGSDMTTKPAPSQGGHQFFGWYPEVTTDEMPKE